MSSENVITANVDPLKVLGLPRQASEQEVRQRYLELVREFPPERDPVRFQQIYAAYKSIEDPLVRARQLVDWDDNPPRSWDEILKEQQAMPPRLSVDVLLSLGNRMGDKPPRSKESPDE